jgi:hydroxyacylglutathione hydrolase
VTITPDALLAMIDSGTAPIVLDVRSRAEFEAGHVPGAVHVPFWKLIFSAPPLPRDPANGIVVYCGHGPRAEMAKTLLAAQGIRKVTCLAGHWSGWKRAGLPSQRP